MSAADHHIVIVGAGFGGLEAARNLARAPVRITLIDRRKDMIISGGFNIYPSDIEAQVRAHPAVDDVAVVGVPSEQWGETPVAFVVPNAGQAVDAPTLMNWYNQRAGKTQRLADLRFVDALPRSAIGKVLKRELREHYLRAG